jgi:hypothetical protein
MFQLSLSRVTIVGLSLSLAMAICSMLTLFGIALTDALTSFDFDRRAYLILALILLLLNSAYLVALTKLVGCLARIDVKEQRSPTYESE